MLDKKADWLWQGHFLLGDDRGLLGRLPNLCCADQEIPDSISGRAESVIKFWVWQHGA